MIDGGIPLSGGQMTFVVRVGDTVGRGTGPWTPAVHHLLRHLESGGFDGTPRVLGTDADDREILTYIEGDAGLVSATHIVPPDLWSDRILTEAAAFLRRFHDATVGCILPAGVRWQGAQPSPEPHQVIDLDGAGPGPRTWDVGYGAYTFVPLSTDERCRAVGVTGSPDRGRRLRLFCDAYGLDHRADLVETIEQRVRAVAVMIRAAAAAGDARFRRKVDEGHAAGYDADAAYLRQHRTALQRVL